jgi:hypothetical protein
MIGTAFATGSMISSMRSSSAATIGRRRVPSSRTGQAGHAHYRNEPSPAPGWAVVADNGWLQGHMYFDLGDDSSFRAVRSGPEPESTRSARQVC